MAELNDLRTLLRLCPPKISWLLFKSEFWRLARLVSEDLRLWLVLQCSYCIEKLLQFASLLAGEALRKVLFFLTTGHGLKVGDFSSDPRHTCKSI